MRLLATFAALLLAGCYADIPGRVVTDVWAESAPCAGRYEVETECAISVGPWPLTTLHRDYCWTHVVR